MRPQGLRLAALAVLLLAGACVRRDRTVRVPEPTPEPAAAAFTPATAENPNRIAVLVPLTGPNAGVGTSIANAATLALLDAREEGIRLRVYDTGPGAAAAANAALADGNRLFLGPLLAADVRAVAAIAEPGGVPIIAFSNDADVAGDGTYILGFTPDQSIARAVRHARDDGAVRFAGLMPEGVYGERAGAALAREVERTGGRLVATQGFARGPGMLAAAARALDAKAEYDAVILADAAVVVADAAPVIRAGRSRGARIIGTELWSTDRTIGGSTRLRGARFAGVDDTRFDQFVTRYRARYDRIPYRLGSLGYDAVLLAVRINREWNAGAPFPDRLLIASEGFSGVDGAFRFRKDGTAERRLAVHEITAAGLTVVSPAEVGFAD